jgi:hypothetical protein
MKSPRNTFLRMYLQRGGTHNSVCVCVCVCMYTYMCISKMDDEYIKIKRTKVSRNILNMSQIDFLNN